MYKVIYDCRACLTGAVIEVNKSTSQEDLQLVYEAGLTDCIELVEEKEAKSKKDK